MVEDVKKNSNKKKRIYWIDSTKGFAMVLVVYCHNFPAINDYIYSFHVPLFFLVSGIFHPEVPLQSFFRTIKKRFLQIMIPFFLWAFILFLFWLLVGRHYGESSTMKLSVINNAIGVVTGQGGRTYMDWGIPLWFLPCIFVVFVIYSFIKLIKSKYLRIFLLLFSVASGYVISFFFEWYFWSFDVALVALMFYALGNEMKSFIIHNKTSFLLIAFFGIMHIVLQLYLGKVDMYRSYYGDNFFLFILAASSGSIFYMLLFQRLPKIKILAFIGRHTISYLALQTRSLTFIKGVLLIFFGMTVFTFSELEKIIITIVQVLLLLPVVYFIDKYIPILNGKNKRI